MRRSWGTPTDGIGSKTNNASRIVNARSLSPVSDARSTIALRIKRNIAAMPNVSLWGWK